MRRVLPPEAFGAWLERFLPGLRTGALGGLATPAAVTDVTDGKLVHLAGLDLTRNGRFSLPNGLWEWVLWEDRKFSGSQPIFSFSVFRLAECGLGLKNRSLGTYWGGARSLA